MKKAIILIIVLFQGFFYLGKAQDFLKFKDSICEDILRKHAERLLDKELVEGRLQAKERPHNPY